MLNILKPNEVIDAARRIRSSGWGKLLICYGIYVLLLLSSGWLVRSIGIGAEITSLLISNAVATVGCVLFMLTIGKRTPESLGLALDGFFKRYALGWLFAAISLCAVWLVNYFFGAIETSLNPGFSGWLLALLFVGFVFQGFMEEFLLRSLIMTQLSLRLGALLGILLNSLLFSLGHVGNSGATWLSTLNTFLIGIVFSLLFYYHDTVWLVSGFHSGWNFILGPVLGVAVSGFELPTSVLATHSNMTRAGLNGGAYGFEAGYPVLALCLILIAGYAALILKNRSRFINDPASASDQPAS